MKKKIRRQLLESLQSLAQLLKLSKLARAQTTILYGKDCFLLQQSWSTKLLGWKMGKKCGIIQINVLQKQSCSGLFSNKQNLIFGLVLTSQSVQSFIVLFHKSFNFFKSKFNASLNLNLEHCTKGGFFSESEICF